MGARRSKWESAEWHLPNGRTIWADAMPTAVELDVSDGTTRHYPMSLPPGTRITGIRVDGRRWAECPERDWDAVDGIKEVDS